MDTLPDLTKLHLIKTRPIPGKLKKNVETIVESEDTSGNPRFSEEQKEEWESVWLDLENPDPLEKRDLASLLSLRFLEPTIEATDITQYDPERPETRFFAYSPSEVIHRKIQQQRKRKS